MGILPDKILHLDQAQHNEMLAMELITQTPITYKDGVIITSFYAAVHYVEAYMAEVQALHTEKDTPIGQSSHRFRENIVGQHLTSVIIDYKELLKASKITRYLSENANAISLAKGEYFSSEDVLNFFNTDLQNIKQAVSDKTGINISIY